MANPMSLAYYNSELASQDPYELDVVLTVTGAGSFELAAPGNAIKASYSSFFGEGSSAACQTAINDFLKTTDEFLADAFDATAVPSSDSVIGLINMGGQCKRVLGALVFCGDQNKAPTTGMTNTAVRVDQLTASSSLPEVAAGADGNIAFRVIAQATNAASGPGDAQFGCVVIKIFWLPK